MCKDQTQFFVSKLLKEHVFLQNVTFAIRCLGSLNLPGLKNNTTQYQGLACLYALDAGTYCSAKFIEKQMKILKDQKCI